MSHKIRSHSKSRKGCSNCKLKRVKCDETKPQCARCIRRGVECIYVQATSRSPAPRRSAPAESPTTHLQSPAHTPAQSCQSSSPAESSTRIDGGGLDPPAQLSPSRERRLSDNQPPYTTKHLLDLRLMHHYSIFTTDHFAKTFPEPVSLVLKINLPRLAFEHEFLMDAILLVAVVHMACTESVPNGPLPVYFYRHQALRSLRQAVAEIKPETSGPVLGASALLATASFAADRIAGQSGLWMTNWLTLVLGQRNFRGTQASEGYPHPFSPLARPRRTDDMPSPSNLYGAFADIPGPGVVPTDIQRALDRLSDADWVYLDPLRSAAQDLGRLISALDGIHEDSWLEKQVKSWAWDMVPAEFLELVRRSHPQALVILVHYLAVFKLMPDVWTYQGVANHDIEEICQTMKPPWTEYITMPKMALRIDDKPTLVRMIVNALPVGA